jgi:hypothetical protein
LISAQKRLSTAGKASCIGVEEEEEQEEVVESLVEKAVFVVTGELKFESAYTSVQQ